MIYEHRVRVRYAETDAMRIVHHASYLVWFEEGRVEALRALGFSFADVEASGFGHAVFQLRVQYRRPARFDQLLVLRVAIVSASGPRMTFGYRLYDADDWEAGGDPQLLAQAVTEMIWVTPEGRPTRLPPAHPVAITLGGQERHPEWAEW